MKQFKKACEDCEIKSICIFGNLPAEQLQTVNSVKTTQSYKRGEIVFYEGNPAHSFFCIFDGRIKLYKFSSDRKRQVVRLVEPGDIMGFRAIISEEPYTVTAETVTKATVCILPKEVLFNLMESSPDFSKRIIAKLAIDLRQSEEKILSFALDAVKKRCASFLIKLIDPDNEVKKGELIDTVPLMRIEIAQIIGISPETLSRTLKTFADEKLIEISRKEIRISDLKRLQLIARQ